MATAQTSVRSRGAAVRGAAGLRAVAAHRARPRPAGIVAPPHAAPPSAAQEARGRARTARRPRRRSGLIVLGSLVIASLVIFGLVLVNIALAQSSFELGDLQKKVGEEQERGRRLRYELARAESPERLAETAAQLGLMSPESEHYLQGPAVLVSSEAEARAGYAGFELSTARP
jgi:cell division protein FtsL